MSNEKKKSGCIGNLLKIFGLLLVLGIVATLLVPSDKEGSDESRSSESSSKPAATTDSSIASPDIPALSEEATSAREGLPMPAGEIQRSTGDTYKASTITKFEPDGLTVMHESGVLKIPFAELPQKLRDTFGYSEAEAQRYKNELQAAQKRQQAERQEKIKKASYEAGFNDGFLVGKTDKHEGRKRDGQKAIRLAKIHSESHTGDKKEYYNGYHLGYNEGWHQAR